MAALTNMKLSREEAKDLATVGPSEIQGPRYPYGLTVSLDNDSLEKLGISQLPDVNETYTLVAQVRVTSVSANESDYGKSRSVGLQITDMALEDGKLGERAAKALYGAAEG
jgi:hypothetical protein